MKVAVISFIKFQILISSKEIGCAIHVHYGLVFIVNVLYEQFSTFVKHLISI